MKFAFSMISNTVDDDFIRRAKKMVVGWLNFRKVIR
jgi:hypothetical protein